MGVSSRRIDIHIEELVLHGVSLADRRAVGDALEQELRTLVATHGVEGLASQSADGVRSSRVQITLAAGARPASLGSAVARSNYRGWR